VPGPVPLAPDSIVRTCETKCLLPKCRRKIPKSTLQRVVAKLVSGFQQQMGYQKMRLSLQKMAKRLRKQRTKVAIWYWHLTAVPKRRRKIPDRNCKETHRNKYQASRDKWGVKDAILIAPNKRKRNRSKRPIQGSNSSSSSSLHSATFVKEKTTGNRRHSRETCEWGERKSVATLARGEQAC